MASLAYRVKVYQGNDPIWNGINVATAMYVNPAENLTHIANKETPQVHRSLRHRHRQLRARPLRLLAADLQPEPRLLHPPFPDRVAPVDDDDGRSVKQWAGEWLDVPFEA